MIMQKFGALRNNREDLGHFMLLTSEKCFLHLVALDNYLAISLIIHFPVDIFFNCWWDVTSHAYIIFICSANTQRFLCIRHCPRYQRNRKNTAEENILNNIYILMNNCYVYYNILEGLKNKKNKSVKKQRHFQSLCRLLSWQLSQYFQQADLWAKTKWSDGYSCDYIQNELKPKRAGHTCEGRPTFNLDLWSGKTLL